MSIIKHLYRHKIFTVAVAGYIIAFIVNVDIGLRALQTSKIYFIEMIQILPPIFVLTSLIQTWVPTKVIMRYFGDGTGIRGKLLSFAIGSLSAGPIYAAFPICKTLIGKGASTYNIVIILSTWAVVKVPMLINEAKFMGIRYMTLRWVLTTIAIFIMAYVMKWWVKKGVVKEMKTQNQGIHIDQRVCVQCGKCLREYPHLCTKKGNQIVIQEANIHQLSIEEQKSFRECCPIGAIQ